MLRTRSTPDPAGPILAAAAIAAAGVAALGVPVSSEHQWVTWVISGAALLVSGAGLGVLIWKQVANPWVRERQMKEPYNAYFRRDDSGSGPSELNVPAHSTVQIQVNRHVTVTHTEHELIFGFEGGAKPLPQSWRNIFVSVGRTSAVDPKESETHSIDDKGNYHIKEDHTRVQGNDYTAGFMVQTRAPGRYPIRLVTISDAGESRPSNQLALVVQPADT